MAAPLDVAVMTLDELQKEVTESRKELANLRQKVATFELREESRQSVCEAMTPMLQGLNKDDLVKVAIDLQTKVKELVEKNKSSSQYAMWLNATTYTRPY